MKLAVDANLPPPLAHAIDALLKPEDGEAISILEKFGRGVADVDWIAALDAEGGWAVLTQDRHLRTRPHERRALGNSGLIVFVLAAGWAKERYWPKAAGVIRWMPAMLISFASAAPPMLFDVPHRWKPAALRRF